MNLMEQAKQQWRSLLIAYRFWQIVKAPYGDFSGIGRLSNAITDEKNAKQLLEFLLQSAQTKQALQTRPRLGTIDLQQLHQLPSNTLGYIYADHMLRNGFNPPPNTPANDPASYLGAHLLETHDIWHIVTGCDTDKAGEIKLQGFYAAQIYPSRLWLAMLAKNLLKTALEDVELCGSHLDALTEGWMLGKRAKPLFGIQWNTMWETPLPELRQQLQLQELSTCAPSNESVLSSVA
jgi:ubiquinone biosynthesis protein COQ4